jgi:hypothetical protein
MGRSSGIIILAILLTISVSSIDSSAQDNHYWTQQYGTQGELLLGTVVGSIIDLSAVYYNPGTLALQENPSILLGAKAFEYQSIKIEDANGDELPLQSTRFGPAPTLFAGILPPKWLDGQLGYSVFTRNDFDFRMQAVGSGLIESDKSDSLTVSGGEILVDQNITGIWGGPTWSRAWGKMGFGISGFVAYQGQNKRTQAILQGLETDGSGASATLIDAVDYWNVRLVFKAGVAWDLSPLTFGVALTAPGIDLFGQGSSLVDIYVDGIDIDGDSVPDTDLIANSIVDAPAQYKSPASIAAGFSYRYKNTTFHFSGEYFGEVELYEVMETVYFDSPTTGDTYAHEMTLGQDDVFNWGFGVEQHIRDWLKAYGSFILDRSAALDSQYTGLAVSTWDLYHLMGGTAFSFIGNDITLGIGYTWGKGPLSRNRNVSNSDGSYDFPSLEQDFSVDYRQWKFIVGFAFGSGGGQSDS